MISLLFDNSLFFALTVMGGGGGGGAVISYTRGVWNKINIVEGVFITQEV